MNSANRIKQARVHLGIEPAEVARTVGISSPHYYDLEGHEDDLSSTLSIAQASKLAAALGTSLPTLLWGENGPVARPLSSLADRIKKGLADGSISHADLPWEPEPLFDGTDCTLIQPINFVKDLATFVGDDWRPYIVFLADSVPEN